MRLAANLILTCVRMEHVLSIYFTHVKRNKQLSGQLRWLTLWLILGRSWDGKIMESSALFCEHVRCSTSVCGTRLTDYHHNANANTTNL